VGNLVLNFILKSDEVLIKKFSYHVTFIGLLDLSSKRIRLFTTRPVENVCVKKIKSIY
jgi:hypothetical protein